MILLRARKEDGKPACEPLYCLVYCLITHLVIDPEDSTSAFVLVLIEGPIEAVITY